MARHASGRNVTGWAKISKIVATITSGTLLAGAMALTIGAAPASAVETPGITVTATTDPPSVTQPGQTVTYSFLVTNSGNVVLREIKVVSQVFTGAGSSPVISCPDEALAPGEAELCTAIYSPTQADIDTVGIVDTVIAEGTPPSTGPVTSVPWTAVVAVFQSPALTVKKTAAPATVTQPGQTVTYSFLVTNTGNVTLSSIEVVDQSFSGTGTPPVITCPDDTLAPGDAETCAATYSPTQADIDSGLITNTAAADGTRPGSVIPTTSTPSTATVTATQDPALTINTTADTTSVAAGQTVTYSFVVTNTGNVTLTDPVVTDTDFSGTGTLSAITCPTGPVVLAPGDTETCTATYAVTAADLSSGELSNAATVSAIAPGGAPIDSTSSTVTVPAVAPVTPVAPAPVNTAGLAVTGSDAVGPALTGAGMLLMGMLALVGTVILRRRRVADDLHESSR